MCWRKKKIISIILGKNSVSQQTPDSQTLIVISVCCPQGAVWVKNLTVHQRLVHISVTEETTAQNNTNYT